MEAYLNQVLAIVDKFGYPIVFLGTIIDNSGVPIYFLTVAILAGMGRLKIIPIIILGLLGSIVRDQVCFFIGKWNRGNMRYLYKLPKKIIDVYTAAERSYHIHGGEIIIWGRLLFGIGAYLPIFAGLYNFPYYRFSWYSFLGSALLIGIFGFIGFFFNHSVWFVINQVKDVNKVLSILIIIVIVSYLGWFSRKNFKNK
jgi:membrane protein DedA with SNARE-associated domain